MSVSVRLCKGVPLCLLYMSGYQYMCLCVCVCMRFCVGCCVCEKVCVCVYGAHTHTAMFASHTASVFYPLDCALVLAAQVTLLCLSLQQQLRKEAREKKQNSLLQFSCKFYTTILLLKTKIIVVMLLFWVAFFKRFVYLYTFVHLESYWLGDTLF